ncbi:ATP-binding protein [Nocardiopsis sediminis]|uniref:ATP-binding protein n=1 Tax=Nocardiopsis sediminis TaxID=1778267 RepID=A0ABV8FSE6_9ACTN
MDVRFEIALPREAYTVAVMRDFLGEALRANGICDDCAFKIQLAASEACSNAVDHGAPAREYTVSTHLDSRTCVLEISHSGPAFSAATVPLPALDSESGRGILMMRELVDEVAFHGAGDGRTTVRLSTHLRHGLDSAEQGRPEVVLC